MLTQTTTSRPIAFGVKELVYSMKEVDYNRVGAQRSGEGEVFIHTQARCHGTSGYTLQMSVIFDLRTLAEKLLCS